MGLTDEGKAATAEAVSPNGNLSGSRTVAVNTAWNFLGRIGPLVVAEVATPFLVKALGPDRWGVFTRALSLVGIFGIFDLGVGKALSRNIAEHVAAENHARAAAVARVGLAAVAVLAVVGALIMAAMLLLTLAMPSLALGLAAGGVFLVVFPACLWKFTLSGSERAWLTGQVVALPMRLRLGRAPGRA